MTTTTTLPPSRLKTAQQQYYFPVQGQLDPPQFRPHRCPSLVQALRINFSPAVSKSFNSNRSFRTDSRTFDSGDWTSLGAFSGSSRFSEQTLVRRRVLSVLSGFGASWPLLSGLALTSSAFSSGAISLRDLTNLSKSGRELRLLMKPSHFLPTWASSSYLASRDMTKVRVISRSREVGGGSWARSRGFSIWLISSRSVLKDNSFQGFLLGLLRSWVANGVLTTRSSGWCNPSPTPPTSQPNIFIKLAHIIMPSITQGLWLLLLLAASSEAKLYQAVALISPGARYHLNDLYDGAQTKGKWGEMTGVGLRQQESLGKAFRKEYIEDVPLLSKGFVKGEYQLLSMGANRTIQSALANLYGMYPLGNGQKLDPAEKQYRYPPYSYREDVAEEVFALPEGQLIQTVSYSSALIEVCPNEAREIEKNIRAQLTDYNEMVLTYAPFLKQMGSTFAVPDPGSMNFTRLAALYDTIRADRYLGRPLPAAFSAADLANIEHLYNWHNHFTRSFDLSKALNTYQLNQVLSNFDSKVKSPGSPNKWLTISVQEADLVAAQNGLGIASAACIEELYRKGSSRALNCEGGTPFASSIVFELHSDNGADFTVRVRNNGKYVNLCGKEQTSCGYDSWKSQARSATTSDPLSVCGRVQGDVEVLAE